jgi:hypothetical protein
LEQPVQQVQWDQLVLSALKVRRAILVQLGRRAPQAQLEPPALKVPRAIPEQSVQQVRWDPLAQSGLKVPKATPA